MMAHDRDALLCDMAQYYGVLDYRSLPASLLATLASGLPDESRIKRSVSGVPATRRELLLAAMVDRLSLLLWFQTEDGRAGINRPASIVSRLLCEGEPTPRGFDSGDDFEAAWAAMTGGGHHGQE